ncbi:MULTISPECIES: LysR family transcriptional regulator [unclassified Fibrobacter]|uniref:LysR family transcriptional regulator n=1 Tax=unclassified Fibrobacter TaxID=2634177 RepID=UPI00090FE7F1|nr:MULTISPECIES: LysR family transcriptional regulator [unclassified Fibrobacter]OWV06343.1 LysR family transcriptional regulator [Fibrobacter sp. UWH1]SHL29443.1 DNA-binding transcriptional regulator, LysR family [Fibrobacter sp. UWH5]
MTLQQLRYAIGIAKVGSFNKAAEALFISQPSLTAAIHDLEDEIGIMIFNRSSRGVTLTPEGEEFIAHANELYHHYETIQERYSKEEQKKKKFAVSTQHYSFAVKSFVEMVKKFNIDDYEFALRETKTKDVIDDVTGLRSEIGILYLSDFNRKYINYLLKEHDLEFHKLIDCHAFAYMWKNHPLANKKSVNLDDLSQYPCLSFEQSESGNYYFAEEILSTNEYHKTIKANDRATMLNLMVGLNGYTLCSGIISEEINGSDYVAVPFKDAKGEDDRTMEIGYITKKNFMLSTICRIYIRELEEYLQAYTSGKAVQE